jgi:nuclear transport factor 2 (NTF2) superfamily protein
MIATRPPLPPFTLETARQKVRAAEDAWNTRDAQRVALAYTEDSRWRNRSEFFTGRRAIVEFLECKWEFDENGLMRRREASINDVPIAGADRCLRRPAGPRAADHPGLAELGLW